MGDELLDNDFYKKRELPARDWWENRRSLFNKFCAASIICLFLITIILFSDSVNFTGALILLLFFSLIFFVVCNISFSGVWILEDIAKKFFNLKTNHEIRKIIFRLVVFLVFLPNIFYLISYFL